jgi:predicted O-methyltransferase YrrM
MTPGDVAEKAIAFLREPREARERVVERLAARRDEAPSAADYVAEPDWEERWHALLGGPWPCDERAEFERVWSEAIADVSARGLRLGRGTYSGWDDADPALARAVSCAVEHLRPAVVVETGVARGLTSRVILEGLGETGRLWSVDIPPLAARSFRSETAVAVPERLHDRWTYVYGSSRRRLPGLLRSLGDVDLFVHDSMHTRRNVLFELHEVWPHLRPGGVAVVDDVQRSAGFGEFAAATPEAESLVASSDDGVALIGLLRKR